MLLLITSFDSHTDQLRDMSEAIVDGYSLGCTEVRYTTGPSPMFWGVILPLSRRPMMFGVGARVRLLEGEHGGGLYLALQRLMFTSDDQYR